MSYPSCASASEWRATSGAASGAEDDFQTFGEGKVETGTATKSIRLDRCIGIEGRVRHAQGKF